MTTKQLIAKAAACTVCDKEHKPRKIGVQQVTWAARDGHHYQPLIGRMLNISGTAAVAALRDLEQS